MSVVGIVQVTAGILSLAYMKTMPGPLREYMADNLRSNYTGGFGVGYLERQYDKSVDWTQINVRISKCCCLFGCRNSISKCIMSSHNTYR